jgi:hypothetical protein
MTVARGKFYWITALNLVAATEGRLSLENIAKECCLYVALWQVRLSKIGD